MLYKILQIFLESNLNIVNEDRLVEYVNFCLDKNTIKTKNKTSHHHILPKAPLLPFTNYSNLDKNPWNGVHLTYENHYIAHLLLTDAIHHYSIRNAFMLMNNCDTSLRGIKVDPKEYDRVMREYIENKTLIKDGDSIANKISRKSARTMAIKQEDGLSIREKATIKMLITQNEEFIDENGEVTTIRKQQIEKKKIIDLAKSPLYDLYHVDIGLLKTKMLRRDLCSISQGLLYTNKNRPLGNNNFSISNLKKTNAINLIGLYAVRL